MTAGDWARVTELFDQARDRPAAERDDWLQAACGDDATRAEVRAMLRAYDADPGFLEAPADVSAAVGPIQQRMSRAAEGRRIGPYRVVREIGRGGMGVVYEAERDDAEFERRVAIKVLPPAWAASVTAERFRFERRVLAGLDHPNIARLLDAGTADDGVPYFVMEYVDGEPIDAWCRAHAPTARRRVEVLLAVCDAVAHAHQHLVVHRDLKPANILITADGHPKLLDFGIATLVSEEGGASASQTRTGQSSFTPEYASPEQVRGDPVTTATDVYSLGVLAYRLLAERPPYELIGLSPLEAMRAICETEPAGPSSVAPPALRAALRGDLDTIILKALRKDPRDRYPSVFGLLADLSAWMDGRPVTAAPATLGYRVRKFVVRHRVSVAAAAVAVLGLAGGGAATAWQARIAGIQRDRAENRLRQVRQFSRSLLFEVHESLRALPGATEPRRLLLSRAVQFLDGLAADAGGDDQLKLELAEGYRRLGQVQGSAVSENVGDLAGATASFEKAVRLGEEVLARQRDSVVAMDVTTGAYDDLSGALLGGGHPDDAERAYARHLALADRLAREHPSNVAARVSAAQSYLNLGTFRATRRDRAGARPFYEKAIAAFASLPESHRSRDEVVASHAFALKRLGALLLVDGRIEDAERLYREALALDESLVARHPDNARHRYSLTFSLSDLALAAGRRGDVDTAIALWTRALDIRHAALAADPKDVRAMQGVANLHRNLANAARDQKRFDVEGSHWRDELKWRDSLVTVTGANPATLLARGWARTNLAGSLLSRAEAAPRGPDRQASVAEARALLADARQDAGRLVPGNGTDTTELRQAIDSQLARAGRR